MGEECTREILDTVERGKGLLGCLSAILKGSAKWVPLGRGGEGKGGHKRHTCEGDRIHARTIAPIAVASPIDEA